MPIRHLVLLRFQPSVAADHIRHIEQEFCKLRSKISAVQALEWGTNNSPEGLAKGFTHCFNLTFADDAARAAYLPHPEHQELLPEPDLVVALRPELLSLVCRCTLQGRERRY